MANFSTHIARNKDVALLRRLEFLSMFSIGAFLMFLIPPARPFALTIVILLMGMWMIALIQSVSTSYLIMLVIMGVFTWKPMPLFFVVSVIAVIMSQGSLLMGQFCLNSSGTTTNIVLQAFYRSTFVLSLFLTLVSMAFLFTGYMTWPSDTSFAFAEAACFVFACAAWSAEKVTGSRHESSSDPPDAFSSNGDSVDRSPIWAVVCAPWIMQAFPIVYTALLLLSPVPATESETMVFFVRFFVLICTLGAQAPFLQRILLAPIRFHARPDATIWIETVGKTYVYNKAIRVFMAPVGAPPKVTELCHVYCTDLNAPKVVVEVMGGTSLCLTPKYPEEFMKTLTQAINYPDDLNHASSLVDI